MKEKRKKKKKKKKKQKRGREKGEVHHRLTTSCCFFLRSNLSLEKILSSLFFFNSLSFSRSSGSGDSTLAMLQLLSPFSSSRRQKKRSGRRSKTKTQQFHRCNSCRDSQSMAAQSSTIIVFLLIIIHPCRVKPSNTLSKAGKKLVIFWNHKKSFKYYIIQ